MIKILCVGKIKEKYLNEFINDYKTRITKYSKIEIVELKDSNILKESEEILKNINDKDFNIIMDINGKKYDSIGFSNLIDKTFTSGYSTITFIIGASDGVTEEVKNKCNLRLSFSDMTFPHGVFRCILLEQIYRSFKILNNESYHK
jgi:23S rRNA (pseudouridine1915-N3)-methyltransferase